MKKMKEFIVQCPDCHIRMPVNRARQLSQCTNRGCFFVFDTKTYEEFESIYFAQEEENKIRKIYNELISTAKEKLGSRFRCPNCGCAFTYGRFRYFNNNDEQKCSPKKCEAIRLKKINKEIEKAEKALTADKLEIKNVRSILKTLKGVSNV